MIKNSILKNIKIIYGELRSIIQNMFFKKDDYLKHCPECGKKEFEIIGNEFFCRFCGLVYDKSFNSNLVKMNVAVLGERDDELFEEVVKHSE